jgi:hypothetical protein
MPQPPEGRGVLAEQDLAAGHVGQEPHPAIRATCRPGRHDGRGKLHETSLVRGVLRGLVFDPDAKPAVCRPWPDDIGDENAPERLVAA